jgi:hypothetical protein
MRVLFLGTHVVPGEKVETGSVQDWNEELMKEMNEVMRMSVRKERKEGRRQGRGALYTSQESSSAARPVSMQTSCLHTKGWGRSVFAREGACI